MSYGNFIICISLCRRGTDVLVFLSVCRLVRKDLKKEEQYVYSIIYFKCSDVRLYDVCAHQAGGILIGALLLSET